MNTETQQQNTYAGPYTKYAYTHCYFRFIHPDPLRRWLRRRDPFFAKGWTVSCAAPCIPEVGDRVCAEDPSLGRRLEGKVRACRFETPLRAEARKRARATLIVEVSLLRIKHIKP